MQAWLKAGGDEESYRATNPIQLNDYDVFKLKTIYGSGLDDEPVTKRFLQKAKALLGEVSFAKIVADEVELRKEGRFVAAKAGEAFGGLILKMVAQAGPKRVEQVKAEIVRREEAGKVKNETLVKRRNAEALTASEIIAAPMPPAADTDAKQKRVIKSRFLQAIMLEEDAKGAGLVADNLLWASPAFVQTTLPHRDPKSDTYSRSNGIRYLDLTAGTNEGQKIGLPYGSKPRLLIHYCASRVQANNSRVIELPNTLYALHKELGLAESAASYLSTAEQAHRLFGCIFNTGECSKAEATGVRRYHGDIHSMVFAEHRSVWWEMSPEQRALFPSQITLSRYLFSLLRDGVFPIRRHAIRALQQSSFAMDLYTWLCWRNFILHSKSHEGVSIPILSDKSTTGLMDQFGGNYAEAKFFVRQLNRELVKVNQVWLGKLNIKIEEGRFILRRSDMQTESQRFYVGGGGK